MPVETTEFHRPDRLDQAMTTHVVQTATAAMPTVKKPHTKAPESSESVNQMIVAMRIIPTPNPASVWTQRGASTDGGDPWESVKLTTAPYAL